MDFFKKVSRLAEIIFFVKHTTQAKRLVFESPSQEYELVRNPSYYYKDIDGLRRPPASAWQPSPVFPYFYKRQMKISAMLKDEGPNNNAHYVNYIPYQPISTIRISRFGTSTLTVFATTTHELAHSTNARAGIYKFLGAEPRLRETYANTIEWHLVNKFCTDWAILPQFNIARGGATFGVPVSAANPFRHENSYQDDRTIDQPIYTSLMVDLIDNENQAVLEASNLFPTDRVSGFTINQIEDEVMNSRSFAELRLNLLPYYVVPNNLLDELFNNW